MLKIRLSMGGAKKRPVYKIVIADSRFPRDGRFIEKVGFFNPLLPKTKKERVNLEVERIKHWISKGAKPTLDKGKKVLDVGCGFGNNLFQYIAGRLLAEHHSKKLILIPPFKGYNGLIAIKGLNLFYDDIIYDMRTRDENYFNVYRNNAIVAQSISEFYYMDETTEAGQDYCYQIILLDDEGNELLESMEQCIAIEESFIAGDINQDGTVNVLDVVSLVNLILSP